MKTKSRIVKLWVAAATAVILSIAGTGAAYAVAFIPEYELPGIIPSGYPNFENSVKLKIRKQGQKGFKMKVRKNGKTSTFNLSNGDIFQVKRSRYKLNAMFDPFGNFLEGTLTIKGRIDTPLGKARGTLMTATLDSFAFTSDLEGSLLGFNTSDIECNSIIEEWVNCTSNESVYIDLDEGGFDPTVKNFKSTGLSVTTVPVPAAVWLFGSGLVALVGMMRRRKH